MVSLIKRGLKTLAQTNAMARIVANLEAVTDTQSNLLRVLTYHRIDDPVRSAHLYPGTLSATPDEFHSQMEYIANRYMIVDIHEVLAAVRGDHALPPKSILITFDDAYQDFAENAWPTLKKWSLPAVLFVATSYPDNQDEAFWWDRLHQAALDANALQTESGQQGVRALVQKVKQLPHHEAMALVDRYCKEHGTQPAKNHVLTWEQLRKLANDGLDLAAHTHTHPLLTRISVNHAIEEVVRSRHDLFCQIGTNLPVFAYPAGACSPSLVEPLAKAGIELAFTTQLGINDLTTANHLLLQRINISANTPQVMLRAQLLSRLRHLMPLLRRI